MTCHMTYAHILLKCFTFQTQDNTFKIDMSVPYHTQESIFVSVYQPKLEEYAQRKGCLHRILHLYDWLSVAMDEAVSHITMVTGSLFTAGSAPGCCALSILNE